MTEKEIAELCGFVAQAGLAGAAETTLIQGFCERAQAAGLPISFAVAFIDTLHPLYEGRTFQWERDKPNATFTEYGRSTEGEAAARWRTSPWFKMLSDGLSVLRRRIGPESGREFPILDRLHRAAQTDYVALLNRFDAEGTIGEMDSFYSGWATDRPEGFSESDVAALARLVPHLGLAIKAASLARIAETLVETYLGRDAGRRVLNGRIERGVADRIKAVLWYSDLRSFTRISDSAEPEQIIPFLNDYADAVISAIHERSGDVLKLIGDGVLAIFPAQERRRACAAALDAARAARAAVAVLNDRRGSEGLPTTDVYLGLHLGVVFYGNIGSKERLDFTVVGPAVNEVSRIAAMCRSVDQPVLISSAFADALGDGEDRRSFVSVGRYALRGVGRPQELFTLDPETGRGRPP